LIAYIDWSRQQKAVSHLMDAWNTDLGVVPMIQYFIPTIHVYFQWWYELWSDEVMGYDHKGERNG